jgi:glutamyl-Q tRNA(Asp) synthetase
VKHPIGRFAPSPTGDLHAGSIIAALGSYLFAKSAQGTWRVRIEDVDGIREVPGAADRQQAQLALLGLHADGEIVRQSDRNALYQTALDRLIAQGLAFECHCSRSDLAAQGGVHRHCVPERKRPDPAWRLRVPYHCEIAFDDLLHGHKQDRVDLDVGDFVLKRADGFWAYQMAVVIDDAAQQISEVIRGSDLLDSTARQIFLQQCLDLPRPVYAHLPLLLDSEGRKHSKTLESEAVTPANAEHVLSQAWRMLGQLPLRTGTKFEAETWLLRALDAFDAGRIPTAQIRT